MDLDHKIAIITGAGSGIGKETAIELARHGCTVALVDIKEDRLAEALDEVRRYTSASTAEVCDVSDEAQVKQMVQAIHERYSGIDILVNNAGIMIVKFFDELSEDEFKRQMDVDFYGAVSLVRAVIPIMQKQGRGIIINVASVGAKLIVPGNTAYAASKAALNAFSESLYYELKDRGIHVGVVLPGGTRTGLFDNAANKLGEYYGSQGRMSPAKVARSIRGAIEKERFETVTPFSDKVYIGFHGALPGLFRKFVLRRLRPYFG
jgi:short-subunit dehydrogenase